MVPVTVADEDGRYVDEAVGLHVRDVATYDPGPDRPEHGIGENAYPVEVNQHGRVAEKRQLISHGASFSSE
jgi:hypothetical protein